MVGREVYGRVALEVNASEFQLSFFGCLYRSTAFQGLATHAWTAYICFCLHESGAESHSSSFTLLEAASARSCRDTSEIGSRIVKVDPGSTSAVGGLRLGFGQKNARHLLISLSLRRTPVLAWCQHRTTGGRRLWKFSTDGKKRRIFPPHKPSSLLIGSLPSIATASLGLRSPRTRRHPKGGHRGAREVPRTATLTGSAPGGHDGRGHGKSEGVGSEAGGGNSRGVGGWGQRTAWGSLPFSGVGVVDCRRWCMCRCRVEYSALWRARSLTDRGRQRYAKQQVLGRWQKILLLCFPAIPVC